MYCTCGHGSVNNRWTRSAQNVNYATACNCTCYSQPQSLHYHSCPQIPNTYRQHCSCFQTPPVYQCTHTQNVLPWQCYYCTCSKSLNDPNSFSQYRYFGGRPPATLWWTSCPRLSSIQATTSSSTKVSNYHNIIFSPPLSSLTPSRIRKLIKHSRA